MRGDPVAELLRDPAVSDAARRVRRAEDAGETVARAAWSAIAEPGDAVAGALIEAVGARDALTAALEARPPTLTLHAEAGARLREARARWQRSADLGAVGRSLRTAAAIGARLIVPADPEWPASVDDLGTHRPVSLWVRGRVELLRAGPRVSIVGARAASSYGEDVAAELAGDLAMSGAVIVSGAAYGIDGTAHRAALGVGGATVAILAGGVDRAYPAGHHRLLRTIAAEGAVVSELPCGAAPTRWRFLSRNRLIAALGDATVVVEAGWRSGSLNTAGHAATLGRPLGAVPGPVTSASSAGCHRLLREYDAQCVTSASEVKELCGFDLDAMGSRPGDASDVTRLLDALSSRAGRSVDELAQRSAVPAERIRALLGFLALEGRAAEDDQGWRRSATAPA